MVSLNTKIPWFTQLPHYHHSVFLKMTLATCYTNAMIMGGRPRLTQVEVLHRRAVSCGRVISVSLQVMCQMVPCSMSKSHLRRHANQYSWVWTLKLPSASHASWRILPTTEKCSFQVPSTWARSLRVFKLSNRLTSFVIKNSMSLSHQVPLPASIRTCAHQLRAF